MAIFTPTYFSPIVQYAKMIQSEVITFEVADNYQKQTYRNRCYIYGANGKQLLSIPIKHTKSKERKKTKDTQIENISPWQSQHIKSLQAAYRSSPFFEFYEDDLMPIFTKKYTYLIDINIDTFLFFTKALELNITYKTTTKYESFPQEKDYRNLAIAKNGVHTSIPKYTQTFDSKHGFINNLSILDLLFMEGPNLINALKKI